MEWLTLAGWAGRPVINKMIKVISDRVLRSIKRTLSVSVEGCNAEVNMWWCPIVFKVLVNSKTPATLKLASIEFVVFSSDNPIQSGHWKSGMKLDSNGYVTDEIINIPGNGWGLIKVSMNPVALGRFPSASEKLALKGVVYLDSYYGSISLPFDESNIRQRDGQEWGKIGAEFDRRFPWLTSRRVDATA